MGPAVGVLLGLQSTAVATHSAPRKSAALDNKRSKDMNESLQTMRQVLGHPMYSV